jgi:hypothetical protein
MFTYFLAQTGLEVKGGGKAVLFQGGIMIAWVKTAANGKRLNPFTNRGQGCPI